MTRPQPQLFVAPSFEALHDVLDDVVRELPSAQGGEAALAEARAAQEVATITLSGGVRALRRACRVASPVAGQQHAAVRLRRRARRAAAAARSTARCRARGAGRLPRRARTARPGRRRRRAGARRAPARRATQRSRRGRAGRRRCWSWRRASCTRPPTLDRTLGPGHVVVLAEAALGAHAGAPSDFFPRPSCRRRWSPRRTRVPPRERELLGLYETALSALALVARRPRSCRSSSACTASFARTSSTTGCSAGTCSRACRSWAWRAASRPTCGASWSSWRCTTTTASPSRRASVTSRVPSLAATPGPCATAGSAMLDVRAAELLDARCVATDGSLARRPSALERDLICAAPP